MPTKTEQSDLYQAVYGRNGDTPLPVVAARSPADCFDTAIEAVRIALRHMTPVILLTDGYIANATELWPIPDFASYEPITTNKPDADTDQAVFERDADTFARLWASPGDARFIHRVGGIEKDVDTGNISYEADNHQAMTDIRTGKVASVARFIAHQEIDQGVSGGLAVVAWGSTYGALYQAVKESLAEGLQVAHIHLRHINPLAENLGELLSQFETILIPELNTGQLATLLRDKLGVHVEQLNKVSGQPLTVAEVKKAIATHATQRIHQVGG
jgi:2-oxoglutarate ferredoxin oxidoreductase subunit alpha